VSPGATGKAPSPAAPERSTLSQARDLTLVLGLFLSGGLWIAYLVFYRDLGLAPRDVGIGFGQVLERSIGALVFIVVMLLLFAYGITYVVVWIRVVLRGSKRKGTPKPSAVVRLMLDEEAERTRGPGVWIFSDRAVRWFTAATLLATFVPVVGAAVTDSDLVTVIAVLVVGGFIVWGVLKADPHDWDVAVVDVRRVLNRVGIFAVALSLGAFALFVAEAKHFASDVKDGKAVQGETLLGIPTTAITAHPTRIEQSARCVLYLGSAEGSSVFYDPRADVIKRVPTGSTRLTIDPDADRCP
jgi:hypothetical protein